MDRVLHIPGCQGPPLVDAARIPFKERILIKILFADERHMCYSAIRIIGDRILNIDYLILSWGFPRRTVRRLA